MSDMKVTMDPRIMKELLLSQIMSGLDPFTQSVQSTQQGSDNSSLFAQMLSQLTASTAGPLDSLGNMDDLTGLSGLDGLDGSNSVSTILGMSLNNQSGSALAALGLNNVGGSSSDFYNSLATLATGEGSAFSYDGLIQQAAAQYGVDPALIKGVIQSESSFRPDAVSAAGAKGLMQLMDGTAQGMGVTDPFDPAQNISGGTRYLSYLLRKYDGNEAVALAAYNAGPGTVDKLGITNDKDLVSRLSELPSETQAYVRKVLNARAAWTSI